MPSLKESEPISILKEKLHILLGIVALFFMYLWMTMERVREKFQKKSP